MIHGRVLVWGLDVRLLLDEIMSADAEVERCGIRCGML